MIELLSINKLLILVESFSVKKYESKTRSVHIQLAFTCSKSITETPERYLNMFKINNRDTRATYWRHSGVFIVNFE